MIFFDFMVEIDNRLVVSKTVLVLKWLAQNFGDQGKSSVIEMSEEDSVRIDL